MTSEQLAGAILADHADASAGLAGALVLLSDQIRSGDSWKRPELFDDDSDGPNILAILKRVENADRLLAGAVGDLRSAIMQAAAGRA